MFQTAERILAKAMEKYEFSVDLLSTGVIRPELPSKVCSVTPNHVRQGASSPASFAAGGTSFSPAASWNGRDSGRPRLATASSGGRAAIVARSHHSSSRSKGARDAFRVALPTSTKPAPPHELVAEHDPVPCSQAEVAAEGGRETVAAWKGEDSHRRRNYSELCDGF